MDPPFLRAYIDHEDFQNKLKLTLLIIILNSFFIVLLIIGAIAYFGKDGIDTVIDLYRSSMKIYFTRPSVRNAVIFIQSSVIYSPIVEEFIYRYPILLLSKKRFRLYIGEYDIAKPLIFLLMISLNTYWANQHILFLPIFISGFPLYWLVIKSGTLWTSITCHATFNLLLYLLVQIFCYLSIISRASNQIQASVF